MRTWHTDPTPPQAPGTDRSDIIATAPTSAPGIEYAITTTDGPTVKVEWLCLEILVKGKSYRHLLIDASALDGLVRAMQRVSELREVARCETDALINRLKDGGSV